MGTSTARVPHATLVANILNLPKGYVSTNQIEGKCAPKMKVVVVEDLISTASSCIEVVNVWRENDVEVLGVASIFTYGMKKGIDRFNEANVKNVSVSNYDVLLEVAAETNYIQEDIKKLLAFRDNPSDASWMDI